MKTSNEILVTCACVTFNHKNFIRQCLDGMLMQETTFPYEIIVYDDCSTDGTTDIVREYVAKYPNKITAIIPSENQYSKIGDFVRETYIHPIAKGKYVALCEGDDYWTDPLKLQKQVDFMEAHPEYSVCFHEFSTYNVKTNGFRKTSNYSIDGEFDITPNMLVNGVENIAQPLTMMYRLSMWNEDWHKHYSHYCDTMENFHLLKVGKGRFLRFVGGQYNMQPGGISAFYSNIKRSWDDCVDYQQMWDYTHDAVVLPKYMKALLWRLQVCKENKMMKEYWGTAFYSLIHNPKIGITIMTKAIHRRFKK